MHMQAAKYKLECQVTKTEGYFILGRDMAAKMNYVAFPEIKPPETSLHNITSASANQVHDQELQSTPKVKTNVDKPKI